MQYFIGDLYECPGGTGINGVTRVEVSPTGCTGDERGNGRLFSLGGVVLHAFKMNSTDATPGTTTPPAPRISEAPTSFKEFMKYIGPAFIFTAAQIGGGEFVTVPLLGTYMGLRAIWLVPLIAYAKIFGQFYLVQYGVVRGKTFLQGCWDKKWLRWLFLLMMLGCVFHSMLMAGLLGNTAGTMNFLIPWDQTLWVIVISVAAFLIVVTKSYELLEKISTVLLWSFLALITLVAILFWPGLDLWATAVSFDLPGGIAGLETSTTIETIAVLFVVLGAGFGPTVSYVWYAKDKKMGMFEAYANGHELELEDLTDVERKRLLGWRKVVLYQNLVSATILSLFSVFIWIAAAQTLYLEGATPQGWGLVTEMVSIFTATYGEWSAILFMACGALAFFSSIIGPLFGFSRLWEESLERFGLYKRFKIKKETVYRICLFGFACLPLAFLLGSGERPMVLFSVASMLSGPILGLLYVLPVFLTNIEVKPTAPDLKTTRYWAMILAVSSGVLLIILSILGIG